MRNTIAALAASSAVAALAGAVAVAPGLLHARASHSDPPAALAADASFVPADGPTISLTQPAGPDRPITVAARDVPGIVSAMLHDGEPGPILQDDRFPLVDESRSKIVHFLWDGTVTTFGIEPAQTLASCAELADAADSAGARCRQVDGLETLVWPAEDAPGVRAHGVWVWQHGYVVSIDSYDNAVAGKDADGNENPPAVTAGPPLSIEELTSIASSQVWFD